MKKIIILLIVTILTTTMWLPVYADETPPTTTDEAITTVTPPAVAPGPPAIITVHRISNICSVYDINLQLLNTFVVSTGRPGHETPLGTYQIYQHVNAASYHPMVDGTYGRFCMRFKKGGYMFHSVCYAYSGAPEPILEEVLSLGTSVSRGCIRLNVADAEWLYNSTSNGCLVVVTDD